MIISSVVFSLDTSAYATGDVLAATQEVVGAVRRPGGWGVLQSLVINEKDDQGIAFDVVLLSANSSIGTENAAVSVTDALADTILGIVPVAAADFIDLGGTRLATLRNLNMPIKAAAGSTSIYVALISRGSPTYTAAGITARFGIVSE